MYRELLVPVDNSRESDWAVERAIEICARSEGRITGSHVYAARLHDIRFRQLEIGLPAQFQEPAEIRRQRKIHDKLIEKGLQLISDSFLDQLHRRCSAAGVTMTRQLLEGINYEEIINEANRGGGRLPSLIGFDPNIAHNYDGSENQRADVQLGDNGRLVAEDEEQEDKLAGTSGRDYDLVTIGAHGLGRQERSRLGGVVARALRGIRKDALIVRNDRPLEGGKWLIGVDGSAYAYKGLRIALEMARKYGAKLYIGSAFDVQYHHVVFNNIKDVLSVQASKVFKFEEQEELHNNIIDKGLLRLCKANIKRAEVMAQEFPDMNFLALDAFFTHGGTQYLEYLAELTPNVVWDVGGPTRISIDNWVKNHGSRNITFAVGPSYADRPNPKRPQILDEILEAPISDEDKGNILHGNIRRVFGLEGGN